MIYDLRFAICETHCFMCRALKLAVLALLLSTINYQLSTTFAFEGRINVAITQGSQTEGLLYTVGTNFLRVEMTGTNRPNPVDILERNSGALMLLFPHNRSFVRLKPAENIPATPLGIPAMPPMPPGIGPQSQLPGVPAMPNGAQPIVPPTGLPPGVGPTNLPGMLPPPLMPATPNTPKIDLQYIVTSASPKPQVPAVPNVLVAGGMPMPAMPMMPMERMELKATGEKTNLLGFACERFEIKQRGETMEIWATDQLLPFQNYVRNQSPRFGPRMMEEQWAGLLTAKKLFPLRASLHFENGPERYRFEVQSITPQKLRDEDMKLFQPPDGYFEIQPLPF
jgi:hypothetical protein